MWRALIMVHDSTDRQKILDALNELPEVVNWRAAVGGIFLATPRSVTADKIGRDLAPKIPGVKFVIAAVDGLAQGNADDLTWEFLNKPKPV